ncbi:MAG: aspartate kinase [Myxococcota bacterium]|nr:aspartate kinase [Myxococcota bacterium]
MIVMKFGGSSLATPEKIRQCAELVASRIGRRPLVVLSACGKTTDNLIAAAEAAMQGRVDTDRIEQYHIELVDALGLDRRVVEPLLYQLTILLHGVSLLRELTPKTLDHIVSFGERMSTRIVASAMAGEGVPAAAYNAYDLGLVTDSKHQSAAPLDGIEAGIAKEIDKIKLVPVVTGFLGKDKNGNITTLGRGGSDFSASIFGAAIHAEEVQIWTDVNGIMTCDPSVDQNAQSLPIVSFDEASELAYYGAEVLHPNTLVPAIRNNIPVRVLNTTNPEDPGTEILTTPVRTERIAKSVVYKENVCLINISSPRLLSAVQILSTAFEALMENHIEVHMATTSEATVSFVTNRHYEEEQLEPAIAQIEKLGRVVVERNKAIICLVGEELRGRVGVLSKIFGALAAQGVKAKMVSQSASEINVAFLVDNTEVAPAVKAIHRLLLDGAS